MKKIGARQAGRRKIRTLLVTGLALFCLLWGGTEAGAANTPKVEKLALTTSGTTIREGQEIKLQISLEAYKNIKNGVNAFKGTLEYDTDVFRKVTQENFTTSNSWESLHYNPQNGQFVLVNKAGSLEEEETFYLKLVAKQSIPDKEIYVAVKEAAVSEGKEDLFPADVSIRLLAAAGGTASDNGTNPDNGIIPDNGNISGNGTVSDNGSISGNGTIPNSGTISANGTTPGNGAASTIREDGTTLDGGATADSESGSDDSESKRDQTGASSDETISGETNEPGENEKPGENATVSRKNRTIKVIFYAIIVLVVLLLVIWLLVIAGRKGKRSGGFKLLVAVTAAGLTAGLLFGTVQASGGKGELSGDGATDYADVELLQKHLIGLELLSEKQHQAADMNSDGKLTVTDLSLLIHAIEKAPDSEASREFIELKDVTGNTLYYRSEEGSTQKVQVLDITGGLPQDLENYYAVIEMENLPDLYAGIREFYREPDTGRVYAFLDQPDIIRYEEDGTMVSGYTFPLAYQNEEGAHFPVASAEELFRKMASNPKGSFELTEDIDASGISDSAAAVPGTFTGELNGNGYRILNLRTSVFDALNNAAVRDLVIENADIMVERRGILANTIANQTVIENVFIINSSIANGVDGLGAFAGELNNGMIRESAALDVSVKGLVAAGGIVGKTNGADTVIENCYVTGKVQGTYDHWNLGARVGGITGWHGGGSIRHSYTRVQIIAPARKGNGGIIGGPNAGSPIIENCLSMSTGAGYRIAGFDVLDQAKNLYEYAGSDSETNITEANKANVKTAENIYDKSLFADTLGFDGAIWNLELLSYRKLPNLIHGPVMENQYGIPNYSQVRQAEGYRMDREQAYANMAKLMPFGDTRMWVEYGNALSAADELAVGTVRFVLPLDGDSGLVTGIFRDSPEKVEKIRIVFENETMREYPVSYQKLLGNLVASYRLEGTDLNYQFHHYAAKPDQALLAQAAGLAGGYDYETELAGLTSEEESRLYTDYYNETVKHGIDVLITKLVTSQEEYPVYCDEPAVQELVRERLLEEEALKKFLYAYNYYDKWYHIDYSGVILSDLMFFGGERMYPGMSAAALTEKVFAATTAQRETTGTVAFYNHMLMEATGKDLMTFLGELSMTVAGYENPNDWFKDNFDGILYEQQGYGTDAFRYRIWDILCGLADSRKTLVLPILTAPQEDMYLISLPSQLMLGSMNRYTAYITKDGDQRERMEQMIADYAETMGLFYGISAKWMSNSQEVLNSFVDIQYDTRMHFPESDKASAGEQKKGETTDPVMKWVYEAAGTWSGINGSAAYANGTEVHWMQYAALGLDFYFFSHETAHNQDGKYFYGGAGRRAGTGGEAHADGNITQEMKDGCMVFNISKINDIGTEMTNNFSYERIDTPQKVQSYYREMFETGYVLDYLAAQAFLSLEPAQQAAVAVQAVHTEGGTNSFSTEYRRLTTEDFVRMKLEDMEDLWENRISIRNPENVPTATSGSYGFESFYWMNWYQSHNDNGSPDTHSFKRLGQEMLGIGGYEDGYIVYMSALSENDLDALRKITGDETITWKKYKQNRYEEVERRLDQIPYFDSGDVIEMFREAFAADSQSGTLSQSIEVKRTLYGIVKRATGDFSNGGIYGNEAVIPVTSAEQLVSLASRNPYGYYKLENDIDFTHVPATGGSYLPDRFIGVIDGGGYKLTGMSYPLFGDLQYAQIKDLTIFQPSYEAEAQAMLAVNSKKVVLGNVTVEDADMQLPLIKTKKEGFYQYGNSDVTVGARKITSPEEFLAIGASENSLKKKYVLETNLDLTGMTSGAFAIGGTFAGSLEGNGYAITGLNAVLFEKVNGADIKNLTLSGSRLTADTQKGAFSNEIKNSTLENVRVRDAVITNQSSQVGGLAGTVQGSILKRISMENVTIKAGDTIGGLAGQFDGTLLEDCLVTGRLEGTLRHQMGARVGGVTGWQGGGVLKNCVTKVEINAPDRTGNGGIIGGPAGGSAAIQNSVSLSTGANAGRIAGWDVLGGSSNVYELETSDSETNIHAGNGMLLFLATEEQAGAGAFYTDTLGWSTEVWDFDGLTAGGTPALR